MKGLGLLLVLVLCVVAASVTTKEVDRSLMERVQKHLELFRKNRMVPILFFPEEEEESGEEGKGELEESEEKLPAEGQTLTFNI